MQIQAINERLTSIRSATKTFVALSPTNLAKEREKFFKNRNYNPQLTYPKTETNALQKNLELLAGVKPPAGDTFANQVVKNRLKETKLKLKLFLAVGNPKQITRISEKLYQCKFNPKSISLAKKDAKIAGIFTPQESLDAQKTKSEIKNYLANYGLKTWKIRIEKDRDFYIQVRHKKELITINEEVNWDFNSLDSTLAHEIDGHVVRALNAAKQKEGLFQNPFPFYIKTEEGLASYLGDYAAVGGSLSLKHHAIKYLAGYIALHNSFREVFNFFLDSGFTPDLAFQRTFRLKRGFTDTSAPGVFAREAIYYEGMLEVKKYIEGGGSLEKLFAGKFGLNDLEYIPTPKSTIIPKRLKLIRQI